MKKWIYTSLAMSICIGLCVMVYIKLVANLSVDHAKVTLCCNEKTSESYYSNKLLPHSASSSDNNTGDAQKIVSDDVWSIDNEYDTIRFSEIASALGVEDDQITPISLNREFLDSLTPGDVINLPLLGAADNYEVFIRQVKKINGVKRVAGYLDGFDFGYTVSISYKGESVTGTITTPEGIFLIKTMKSSPFIMKDKNHISGTTLIQTQ